MSPLTNLHRQSLAKIEALRFDNPTQADKVTSALRESLYRHYTGDMADAQLRELLTSTAQGEFETILDHFSEVFPSALNTAAHG